MRIFHVFNLIIILIILCIQFGHSYSKIIFVFEHVRHGTRTPPFDEDSNYIDQFGTKWEGDGELTTIGKRLHTILGIQNRMKYSSLINFSKLDPKEIKIISTNSIRTLKSLEAELHAMYIPGTGDILTEKEIKIAYPPGKDFLPKGIEIEISNLEDAAVFNKTNLFPIQFFPTGKVFINEPDQCPYMTEYRKILAKRTNESLYKFTKEFENKFGDKLSEYLGYKNNDWLYDFDSLIAVTDNYICNYDNDKDLTDFLTKTGFNKEEFHNYTIRVKEFYLFNLSSDEIAGDLGATPHMVDLLDYMEKKVKNESYYSYSAPKMVIQGGHDTTVNLIQYFMFTAFNIPVKYVKFGAHIYFELHKDDNINNKYFVRYFYDGEKLLEKDYYEFKKRVSEVIWSNQKIKEFCFQEKNDKGNDDDKGSFKINVVNLTLIITNVIFLTTTIVFLYSFIYYKKKFNNSDKVPSEPLVY